MQQHAEADLTITQILEYHTDVPLEFLEMPVTVTIDSRDPDSPLRELRLSQLLAGGENYELVVLLTFVDNQSSRMIELRKHWRLGPEEIDWGQSFTSIIRRTSQGSASYEIDVEALDEKSQLPDHLNISFAAFAAQHRPAPVEPSIGKK